MINAQNRQLKQSNATKQANATKSVIDTMGTSVSEVSQKQTNVREWRSVLQSKSLATSTQYGYYINSFRKSMGNVDYYVQQDIDGYFADLAKADSQKP